MSCLYRSLLHSKSAEPWIQCSSCHICHPPSYAAITVAVLGAGHFGHKTLWQRDTSAPQNWCPSLSRITGGAVSHRNCPGSKCPGFSSITALVSKCLVPRFWCRSVLRPVPKCPRMSWCRSVLWPKCPVTAVFIETNALSSKPNCHSVIRYSLHLYSKMYNSIVSSLYTW